MFDTIEQQHTFEKNNINDITQSLANYLPSDNYFLSKNKQEGFFDSFNDQFSNLRRLLIAYSWEFFRVEDEFKTTADNIDPWLTYEFLDQWEAFVGIPDECFKVTDETHIDTRRRYIVAKLALMEVFSAQDWVDLAAFLGYNIELVYGTEIGLEDFPYQFPFFFYSDEDSAAYTIYVRVFETEPEVDTFPLPFPFTFGNREITFLKCLFEKIKPAHMRVVFLPEEVS